MGYYKNKLSDSEFKNQEMKINFLGGFVAGVVAAALTNPLECVTVNMQTTDNFKIGKFIKEEGAWNICIKGLTPRVAYNGAQSLLFFTLVKVIGNIYDVDLGED